jgi:hypothetical protein
MEKAMEQVECMASITGNTRCMISSAFNTTPAGKMALFETK